MKRVFCWMLTLALAVGMAAPVLAEDTVPSPTPAVTATPSPYSGTKAYVVASTITDAAGGEVSAVAWGDVVNVVLKVVDHSAAAYSVQPQDIAARVNSSVFTYTGTAEVGQFTEGQDADGYYYSYVLLFRDVIYNGGGTAFPVDLSYLNSTLPMQQLSVTLGQCLDEDPNDPSKARTPNLVVRESSYGTDAVTAGDPFSLDLTVYATSGTEDLNDVVVSITLPDGVTLTGGSLSMYVGSLAAQRTCRVSFQILPSASFTGGVANIGVQMTGTGAVSGGTASGSTTISVPISQPDRFELGQLLLDDYLMPGSYTSVALNFVNKGKNPVSNLEATLSGENLGADTTYLYVGNVAAGTEGSVDFDLCPELPGPMTGTITLSYEDANGQIKTVTQDFETTIQELPVYEDPGFYEEIPVAEEPQGLPGWGIALLVLAAAGVVIAVVLVVRRRKKAQKLAELEDTEDEDL